MTRCKVCRKNHEYATRVCQPCLIKRRAQHAEKVAIRGAAGLCIRCGLFDVRPGHRTCHTCRQESVKNYRAEKAVKCRVCKNPNSNGLSRCAACLQGDRDKRQMRKALGLCTKCGVKLDEGFRFKKCRPCLDGNARRKRAAAQRKRMNCRIEGSATRLENPNQVHESSVLDDFLKGK